MEDKIEEIIRMRESIDYNIKINNELKRNNKFLDIFFIFIVVVFIIVFSVVIYSFYTQQQK